MGPQGAPEPSGRPAPVPCPRPVPFRALRLDGSGQYRRDPSADFDRPCGCWRCPACGPVKQRRHVAHFVDVFANLRGLHFVTLTLDPKTGLSERLSRKYLQHCWSKWRKRLARLCDKRGTAFRFVRVIEYQDNGQAHAHVILTAEGVSASEMSAAWFECGGGVVCDVQPFYGSDRDEVARRVGYGIKYALKDAQAPKAPKGRHYVETSEGIGYGSAQAVAKRAAYVAASQASEEKPVGGLDREPVRVWTVNAPRPAKPSNPDAITPADLAAFAALDLDKRSRAYRSRSAAGVWYLHRQHLDGSRTADAQHGYRSLYEVRTGAERTAVQSRLLALARAG